MEEPGHVVDVLLVERLVEAEAVSAGRQAVGVGVLAEDRRTGIAGKRVDEHDHEHGQAEQDRDQEEQATDDVLEHESLGGLKAADRRVPGKRCFPGTQVSRDPGLIGDQDPASFQTMLKYSDWVGLVM